MLALLVFVLQMAVADDAPMDQIAAYLRATQDTATHGQKPCPHSNPPIVTAPQDFPYKKTETVQGVDKTIDVSVISKARIKDLLYLYPDKLRQKHQELCVDRAHSIGDKLGQKKIETAKLLLQGKIYVTLPETDSHYGQQLIWPFHVVNLIYIKDGNRPAEQYVIDPFLDSRPIPRKQWDYYMSHNSNSSFKTIVLSRFNNATNDINHVADKYTDGSIQAANDRLNGDPRVHDQNLGE